MHQAEYRPKNLGLSDLAARVDVVEDGWLDEEALLIARDARAAPIDQQLGALVGALADHLLDALFALGGDHRPHLDARVEAVADLARCGGLGDALAEHIARLADRDGDRGG